MPQFQLDNYKVEPDKTQEKKDRRRLLILILVAVAGGLVLGYFAAITWLIPPPAQTIQLSHAEQDDYIIMVAEAYALDRDVPLAQQRLTRLNDPNTSQRIIGLAKDYAPQGDYIAQRLALLAVAAGSKDKTLVALASTVTAPTATPTYTPTGVLPPPPPGAALPTLTPLPTLTLVPNYIVITGVPTATPPTTPTRLPTWTPTPVIQTQNDRPASIAAMPVSWVAQRVALNVPGYANFPSSTIALTTRPKVCTPADHMPAVVTESTLLCPGQTYAPFSLQGNNFTLYGDTAKTAVVQGAPRGYGITVDGNNITVIGVHVQGATRDGDMNNWLCLYPSCFYAPDLGGARGYGGGILLHNTSNAAVLDSVFYGGTTGIFSERGYSNKIFNNSFSDHNGWGILLMQTRGEYVVANTFARINRACVGLDNVHHDTGCESSAIEMTQVHDTLVYNNTCRRVSECYYANGDGGYGSVNIHFYNNICAGAKNNCFEVTFGMGHEFDYNVAEFDADYGDPCDYPFWIGGSTAYFGPNNHWSCLHDFDTSLTDASSKSDQPTQALALAERPTLTPTLVPTRQPRPVRTLVAGPMQPDVSK